MSEGPHLRLTAPASGGAIRAAKAILGVPRFSRAEKPRAEGWLTNGIFYPRTCQESLGRLARVIRLKRRWESVDLRLSFERDRGRPGLGIWWKAKNSALGITQKEGARRGGKPRLSDEEREARLIARREQAKLHTREVTAARREAGTCLDCGGARGNHVYCARCREKRNAYNKRKAANRRLKEETR